MNVKNRWKLRKIPYILLIAGLTAVAADSIYIAVYAYSLTPDALAVYFDKITAMIEYIFASLAVLIGGTLLFDYEIKSKENE